METIGDLLSRDLSQRIEEVIQVHQADEQSVYSEVSEYVATNSIRDQYAVLLKAVAEAPAEPYESIGVWVSGFFGSGKSSFAKNFGYALKNPKVLGEDFARLFKRQLDDERIANLLDLINAKIPTEVILFEVAKEKLHFPRNPIGERAPADEISPPHLPGRKLPQPWSVR